MQAICWLPKNAKLYLQDVKLKFGILYIVLDFEQSLETLSILST
jgi:hypothetical protein